MPAPDEILDGMLANVALSSEISFSDMMNHHSMKFLSEDLISYALTN
jgi:hypothetical protein